MKLLLLLLVLVVVGLVVAVAAGSITGGLGDPARSTPDPGLPPGPLHAADLERVRFTPALRGYRMDQVDALLDRLRDQLAVAEEEARRARLARLVTDPAPAVPVPEPEAGHDAEPDPGPGPEPGREPGREHDHEPEVVGGVGRDATGATDEVVVTQDAVAEVLQHPGPGPARG